MTRQSSITGVLAAVRSAHPHAPPLPVRICIACAKSMPVDGVALSLLRKAPEWERIGASDAATAEIEELQMTLGEGPAIEALASGRLVLIPDLRREAAGRWPAFADAAGATEMRALYVVPVQIGAVRLGALSLYRRTPGSLPAEALADALRVAALIAMLLLGDEGDMTDELAQGWLEGTSWAREIHQATGMLISQLGVGAEEAFVRLRAFAFANDRALNEVARAVVARHLLIGEADA